MTETDIRHPIFARVFHRLLRPSEGALFDDYRRELLDGLAGEVVEIGAGDGANFSFYPATVTRVTAVEPEPYLRARATEAANGAPVPITVSPGRDERLPLEDESVDSAVFSLVLCSVRDPAAALAEARRVLRPNGELRVLEHVIADHRVGSVAQRAAQRTVWPLLCGNCHPARDTLRTIEAAGLQTDGIRRVTLRGAGPPMPIILGRATR